MKVKAIIYDLDDTLYSSKSLNRAPFDPFFRHFKGWALNHLTAKDFQDLVEALWTRPIDQVLNQYPLPMDKVQESLEVLKTIHLQSSDLTGTRGLELIPRFCEENYLVTSGIPELQYAKINALGIPHYFKEIIIDNPMSRDPGKGPIFQKLLRRWNHEAKHIMVVGDNPEAEIKAGVQLGFFTVQKLKQGMDRAEMADWVINDLHDLDTLFHQHNIAQNSRQ